jgi:hypothetical protein
MFDPNVALANPGVRADMEFWIDTGAFTFFGAGAAVIGELAAEGSGANSGRGTLISLGKKGRVAFNGMEVRAVRDLSHVEETTLRAMAADGFAARTLTVKRSRFTISNRIPPAL